MDSLHERLAELADDAPSGGAPPAELWARGKRNHRVRVAALAATVLMVGVVGTGIGVRLFDGGDQRSGVPPATGTDDDAPPAGTDGFALPIEYPVGEELPDLGDTPGPLAAIWLAPPRVDGGAPEAVGLVAESGMFGTLPIDVSNPNDAADAGVALSPDGRRIAYQNQMGQLIVADLARGDSYASGSEFKTRGGFVWIETTLLGRVAGGGDRDGWVWEPGTGLKLINPTTYELPNDALWFARPGVVGPGTRDWWVAVPGGGPRSCSPPTVENHSERFEVPELCDVLGFTPTTLIGHGNSDHMPGEWNDPSDVNGTVVADPGWPDDRDDSRVVVAAGAPERVAFAVDLIAAALETTGGGS